MQASDFEDGGRAHVAFRQLGLPEYCWAGIQAYVLTGRPVGDFLTALLRNDLKAACMHADGYNQRVLFQWGSFLYRWMPGGAWMSEDNIREWRERGGLNGCE